MEKILFELDPDTWHGHETESIWATPLGGGLYQVENTPFFVPGVSYGDIVEVTQRAGTNLASRTQTPSGHSTYRIIPNEAQSAAQFEHYWQPLGDAGCSYEHGDFGYDLYAVDVPKEVDVKTVFAHLEYGESIGVWEFEEGHCGHIV